jgi:hypothetical protein
MSDFSLDMTVPAAMPLLSRGKHRNPAQGACFMEYTSLLAGEPFTDGPRCVDGELAAVLRSANDRLSDGDRALLVPLLGRAIGAAIPPPPAGRASRPRSAASPRGAGPLPRADRTSAPGGVAAVHGSRRGGLLPGSTGLVRVGRGAALAVLGADERADRAHDVGGLRTAAHRASAPAAPVLRGGHGRPRVAPHRAGRPGRADHGMTVSRRRPRGRTALGRVARGSG